MEVINIAGQESEGEYVSLNDMSEPAMNIVADNSEDPRCRLQHALLDPELPRPIKAQFEMEADENDLTQMECTRLTAFLAQVLIMVCVIFIILPATRILGIACVSVVVVTLITSRILCCIRGRHKVQLLQTKAERWIRPSREIFASDVEVASTGECAICLQELVENGSSSTQSLLSESGPSCESVDILRLPCGHLFHSACLRTWFDAAISCPVCRSGGVECAPSRLRVLANTDVQPWWLERASGASLWGESNPSEALLGDGDVDEDMG